MLNLNKKDSLMHKMKNLALLTLILILSAGCIQKTQPIKVNDSTQLPIVGTEQPIIYNPNPIVYQPPIIYPEVIQPIEEPPYVPQRTPYLQGAYGNNNKLKQFIAQISSKYNYDQYELNAIFSTVNRDTEALKKYNVYKTAKPASKVTEIGSWDKYRANFLTPSRISKGVEFWQENAHYLNKAAHIYGVAPEYIVGIIGVETNFGGYTGTHSVLDALTTLSIEYTARATFFTSELENYLLMLRDEQVDPQKIKGSYAGAFGLAQFMPSSFREYAIDFNGDGHINLFNKADAIGSIANYFIGRGKWQPNLPITMQTYYSKARFYGLPTGHKTSYTQAHMTSLGMRPTSNFSGYKGNVSLIKLSKYNRDELWWGTPNFRAITRYNPKDYYAMAVHQLSLAIRQAKYGR
ncbi:MAG: Membrane-bound lytic murein transglycosylase B precursor (EC [uncultured Sulfurovum sp.]|uniref:Membrane-bound lytic murein transglycosylase B (EC) n=1 Tax=uncultured Sulfurovum sp. TaxID=269237 RepID=A0A6S6S1B7_9BACT|nr:MAG: Membrane-bound lytic murein transglycosylase B precursor (EC [uncultured Sulfurovum sp.]